MNTARTRRVNTKTETGWCFCKPRNATDGQQIPGDEDTGVEQVLPPSQPSEESKPAKTLLWDLRLLQL